MAKTKIKRPPLRKVLQQLDQMPDDMFGDVEIDLSTLPCLERPRKIKTTVSVDVDLLYSIQAFAKKRKVSASEVMNDVLRKAFELHDLI